MSHEVYICYDDKDQLTADAICHVLEENKIKCWLKNRDVGVKHIVDEVTEAINQASAIVLIFSNHSKHSNFVNTEVDLAFTLEKPILVFKIDESKLDGGLEFFLNNKHWLDAYPNPEVEFEHLIIDTSKLLGKPISKPVISRKNKHIKKDAHKKHDVKAKKKTSDSKSNKIPIIIAVVAVAAIAIVGGYFLLNSQMGLEHTTLVLSDSAYMEVPKVSNASSKADKSGIFYYVDSKNEFNVTSCNYDLAKKSAKSKMNDLKKSLESESNVINAGNVVIYENNGVYSIFAEDNEYNQSVLIQSKNKDLLIESWSTLKFHNPADIFKVDDSKDVVNVTKETENVISESTSSSDSSDSHSTASSSQSSSQSQSAATSDSAGYSDWASSGSGDSGGASYSDWASDSGGSRDSGGSGDSRAGYGDW